MRVGRVHELWRYPVKSMQGEQLARSEVLHTYGFPGDRGWAIRDEESGEIRGASKIHELMRFSAQYLDEPSGDATPPVVIRFDDGRRVQSDDPEVGRILSAELGREVTLWPRQPASNIEHHRRRTQPNETELRERMGLVDGEPMPDHEAAAPPEMFALLREFTCPPGTYFDAYPLHLITTGSMATLAARTPGSVVGSRRFRPNLVVDTGDAEAPFPEGEWWGRRLRMGSVVGEVTMGVPRCSVITMPHADLPRERSLLRTLVRDTGMTFGAYLTVLERGTIAQGDRVELLDPVDD
jgi:uncharacterized protein YcbX